MKTDKLMDALNNVEDEYILDAAPGRKKTTRFPIPLIAASLILAMLVLFCQTAPGAAALENVREAVSGIIESLYPPKDIPVEVEGEVENIPQEAGGQEPQTQPDGTLAAPGFAIYYDPERYEMTEEEGITYIRFVSDGDLPPCQVEISHVPGISCADAAGQTRLEMLESWDSVSEISPLDNQDGLAFSFSAGVEWNSPCGNVYFISDEQGGCFRLTARYFVEAAEGHGARFGQMITTFRVIAP